MPATLPVSSDRRPHLLVLASTFPAREGDGVPAFVLDLARQEAREFRVTVLTPRVSGAAAHETIDGVDVRRFAYFPRRFENLADGAILDNLRAHRIRWLQVPFLLMAQTIAIRRVVMQGVDVIHAHWVIPQGLTAAIGARRTPTLVTTHGGDIYALRTGVPGALKRMLLRRAPRISTVNSEMRDQLVAWGVSADRIRVLPMGVPLDEASAAAEGAERVPRRILVVGRLVEKKGIAVLLEALRRHVRTSGWELLVGGDGPLRSRLERHAARMPVRFLGQIGRAQVLREMAQAEVFAIPSIPASNGDKEGLPVTLLEAAAIGCAIVASRLPGIDEAIADHESGLLVEPSDEHTLAAAIDELLSDSSLRARLGAAAAERAKDFSIDRIGASYRRLLWETIDSSRADRATQLAGRSRRTIVSRQAPPGFPSTSPQV